MNADAYLRLRSVGPPIAGGASSTPGPLVFVDVEPDQSSDDSERSAYLLKRLTEAPPGFFLQASIVLFRWPEHEGDEAVAPPPEADSADAEQASASLAAQIDAIRELLQTRFARMPHIGIVRFKVGERPTITWSRERRPVEDDDSLLKRARNAEIQALLGWGNAVWEPRDYHYVLPSGEHSSAFVRLADSFRQPRDPSALATWLFQHLVDELAVIVDSATLLPLVSAIEVAMERAGLSGLQSIYLADYQVNHYELEMLIADAADAEKVLALISVSSTGATARNMASALGRRQQPYTIETLVSRRASRSTQAAKGHGVIAPPWCELGLRAETYSSSDTCALCRQAEKSRYVYVDPRSFVPIVLPRPDLMVPAVHQAHKNRALWQYYDRTMGSGIHAKPHQSTQEFRHGRTRLAVRCYPHWILDPDRYEDSRSDPSQQIGSYEDFCAELEARVSEIASEISSAEQSRQSGDAFVPAEIDLIVVTETDRASPGFERFTNLVQRSLGITQSPEIIEVSSPYADMTRHRESIANKHQILVIALGAITGTSMQQLLVGLHSEIQPSTGAAPQIAGLVMHARYESMREWSVLRNAYTRLHSIWSTPLSLTSPFESEATLLNFVPRPTDSSAQAFYDARLQFLNGLDPDWEHRINPAASDVDPWAVFWGMPIGISDDGGGRSSPRLRPGSFFGHQLNAVCTFAAVGSAVQQARLSRRNSTAPSFSQFEMPAILRSYFDAPIIASIVRWIEPHEAWWGDRPTDSANVLAELFARASSAETKILLPEFLLAAAAGKVSASGMSWLRARAAHIIWCTEAGAAAHPDNDPWSEQETGPVRLGLALLQPDSRTSSDHFELVEERLEQARSRVNTMRVAGRTDPSGDSLATSYLLWALDTFLN